jgi:hypothetical protein
MPDTVQKVDHYSCEIPNKIGEGARLLAAFREAGVNFTAVWAYPIPARKARVEMIPQDRGALTKAAKKAGVKLSGRQTAFLVSGDDHPGVLSEPLSKLAEAGINVVAAQAVCAGQNRFGAVIFVGPDDVRKAAKVLGA